MRLDSSRPFDENSRMAKTASQASGILLVTLSALGWSSAGLFTRLVTADSWSIIGWRGVFSGLAILIFLICKDRGGVLRSFMLLGWPGWLVATISTLASIAYVDALESTSVANVVVIYATAPFVTAALAWAFVRERPAPSTLLAAGMAWVGVFIMVGGGGARGTIAGVVLAFAMTVGMGILTVITRWARGISMIPATCVSAVQLAVIGALAAPLLALSMHDFVVLAAFGTVQATAVACYVEGARLLASARTALLSALDVPLAPVWVLLVVGEVPALASILGGVIVLAAVFWDVLQSGDALASAHSRKQEGTSW
jgi:drug/metabolite transporter (DMT)-like permease